VVLMGKQAFGIAELLERRGLSRLDEIGHKLRRPLGKSFGGCGRYCLRTMSRSSTSESIALSRSCWATYI
jgi:hypothetical protein